MTVHYPLSSETRRPLPLAVAAAANDPTAPLAVPSPIRQSLYRRRLKRAFDTFAILLGLPFVLPTVLVFALLLLVQDGSNPFYRQDRIGRGGRVYRIWKLRTMVPDAEAQLSAHLVCDAAARCEWETTQKLKDDPRVTRLGRLLRKTSLDELPQLWNVLKGDMSLVGPRPMMPDQARLYPGTAYYAVRPGITGPWQVSERNESSFAERAQYDTRYELDLSFATDLKLLLATVRVVLRGTGY